MTSRTTYDDGTSTWTATPMSRKELRAIRKLKKQNQRAVTTCLYPGCGREFVSFIEGHGGILYHDFDHPEVGSRVCYLHPGIYRLVVEA